jgi:broad specificity phosphatase PhoE
LPELLLVRHAATDWSGRRYCGRTDLPLNLAGVGAARSLAVRLADEPSREAASSLVTRLRIVSSPLRRARQTAEALLEALPGADLRIDDRWSEVDFGDVEGMTYSELSRAWPDLAAGLATGSFGVDWPGGESATVFAARVTAAFHDVADSDRPTFVVSHGGPLRLAIALATGCDPSEVTAPEPGHVWRRPAGPHGGATDGR